MEIETYEKPLDPQSLTALIHSKRGDLAYNNRFKAQNSQAANPDAQLAQAYAKTQGSQERRPTIPTKQAKPQPYRLGERDVVLGGI